MLQAGTAARKLCGWNQLGCVGTLSKAFDEVLILELCVALEDLGFRVQE